MITLKHLKSEGFIVCFTLFLLLLLAAYDFFIGLPHPTKLETLNQYNWWYGFIWTLECFLFPFIFFIYVMRNGGKL